MVFDWRTLRYRGGSGWRQPAFVVTYVGIIVGAAAVTPGDEVTTENAAFARAVTVAVGVFTRAETLANAAFARTVTTTETER